MMNTVYQQDPVSGVFRRLDMQAFGYSDAADAEDRIQHIIENAVDRATGSEELSAYINDWVSFYHLSPMRADLLRPFQRLFGRNVLEVGPGCGPITRYLGENTPRVIAVEGSLRRATITAARCKGLTHVSIYCDTIENFNIDEKFDLVTCIGVIEYANCFAKTPNGFDKMLRQLAEFLSPAGYLLIAIENRLGLKYFAGAPEDHMNIPFYGIEDFYVENSPLTLGKQEWEDRFRDAGLEIESFYYPFPDYKRPSLILSEAAFRAPNLDLSSLLRNQPAPNLNWDYTRFFSEQMSWPVILRNRLAESMSNSFLILVRKAGRQQDPIGGSKSAVAFSYSTYRRRHYSKETRIEEHNDSWIIRRRRLYPDAPASDEIIHLITDEKLYPGTQLGDLLFPIINRPGWTIDHVIEWARPWVDFLHTHASPTNDDAILSPTLPQNFLDCTPFNIIRLPNGTLLPFDLEYRSKTPVSFAHVIFRGLYCSFERARFCCMPADPECLRISYTVFAVMDVLSLHTDPSQQRALMEKEAAFRFVVVGTPMSLSMQVLQEQKLSTLRVPVGNDMKQDHECRSPNCQLFWHGQGEGFSEAMSTNVSLPQGPPSSVILHIPLLQCSPIKLRLDPSDRAGAASLHAIRLLDDQNDLLWEWDHTAEPLIDSSCHHVGISDVPVKEGGIIIHCYTADPQIVLPIPEAALGSLQRGGSLEVKIAWLDIGSYLQRLDNRKSAATDSQKGDNSERR